MFLLSLLGYRITDLLDYTAEEFTGKSLYALCHGEDADKLRKCHLDCKLFTTFEMNIENTNSFCHFSNQ